MDKVNALKAQLVEAEYKVKELKAQVDAAVASVAQAQAQKAGLKAAWEAAIANVADARAKRDLANSSLLIGGAVLKDDPAALSKFQLDKLRQTLAEAEAAVKVALAKEEQARITYADEAEATIQVALANEKKAEAAFASQIDGVPTSVAALKAELAKAEYYLDNTTMRAPEDGYLINLQVREGMVAGTVRFGAIASFVVDSGRYVLATYNQENLLWVKAGQPVEVAMDLYPGRIFKGKVKAIWWGSGEGQYLPSGDLPKFSPPPPNTPQGRYAVEIDLDDQDQSKFPIGAQGAAAIYTEGGGFAALRKIGIRGYTWFNWLYPLSF